MTRLSSSIFVILATYNGDLYLEEQLNSILAQELPSDVSLHVLISDDGSTDQTMNLLEGFEARNHNVEVLKEKDWIRKGTSQNFYFLLSQANLRGADFVALADQDDKWLSGKIMRALEMLKESSEPALYLGSATIVDKDLTPISHTPKWGTRTSLPSLLLSNQRPGMTFVFNREVCQFLLEYQESLIAMHDWWFQLIFALSQGKLLEDDKSLVLYRQHDSNVIGIATNYRSKIFKAFTRGTEHFELRSAQARKLIEAGISQDNKDLFLVAKLIDPLISSIPPLILVLSKSKFFSNKIGVQRVEARILFLMSFIVYHTRKKN